MSEEEHSVGVIFNAFDLNKDGRLTFSDMRLGFQNMGVDIADEELKEMMDAVSWTCVTAYISKTNRLH